MSVMFSRSPVSTISTRSGILVIPRQFLGARRKARPGGRVSFSGACCRQNFANLDF